MSDAEGPKNVETHSRPEESGDSGPNTASNDVEGKAKKATATEDAEANPQEDSSMPDARDDSEAETVVLPGKEDASSTPRRKVIKHEGNDDSKPTAPESEGASRTEKASSKTTSDSQEKKLNKDLTATSSNLSSAKSSPAPDTAPSPAGSDDGFAKPSSNFDEDSRPKGLLLRKRKNTSEEVEEKGHKRRQRRDVSLDSATNTTVSDRDRREKREVSNSRSESPQTRTRTRATSIKSTQIPGQKRKKPPPLQVGSRTRASVDADDGSEDSDRRTGPNRIRKLASAEASAMSPAKPPHKKLKDKSGRTWLARACDSEDVEAVKARLAERPEDLNVEDYAGNTPLQIAALAGSDDIVKVLLEADCDIHCKNVDKDTPLIDAVENGHLEVIKLLIDAGMDPGQSNARGEELLDLLNSDGDNYDKIREVLIKAKEKRRRTSEDHNRASTARSPRESAQPSPPPPMISGSRRQRSRRDPTRNDLLYVNATPENLREKAKIGDDEAVDHILNMRPIADLPAVLAAARGGHEMSLQLLIAIGKPEADPDPVAGTNKGQSTPMLAAVGRGNLRVLQLLLNQPGFNPTRRLYNNMTYYELAKDRRGIEWESEYRLLKKAHDNYKARNSNGSSPNNKRDSQAHRELKKSKSESGTSAPAISKRASSEMTRDGLKRKEPGLKVTSVLERREKDRDGEKVTETSRKHLRVPSKTGSREPSSAISDREVSPLAVPKDKVKKHKRSLSDAEVQEQEMPKPTRKRLISGRMLRDDEEKRRRTSLVSVASSSSQEPAKQKDSPNGQARKIKREESRDSSKMRDLEHAKKRPRPSPSPSEGNNTPSLRKSPDLKKSKRLRVDSEGKPIKKRDQSTESARRDSPQPLAERSSSTKSAAPVAFMGGPASQSKEAKTKLPDASMQSPKAETRKVSSTHSSPKSASSNKEVKRERETEDKEHSEMSKQPEDKVQTAAEQEERKRKDKELKEQEEKAKELAHQERAEKEKQRKEQEEKEMLEQQEKERIAREEAAAREEADRKAKEEAARQEAQRLAEEEAERKAKAEREAEEARQEQKRQEEEQARRVAERERQRKEEEERQVRRRAEQEERERVARIRKREEDERRRREALPNALKILAEFTPDQARQESEVRHWLPLYTAKGAQLNADRESSGSDELWVSNVQVAPLLGVSDLDLSQYTAWSKRPANKSERASLWRVLRRRLTRYEPPTFGPVDHTLEFRMDREARDKYDALNRVFWIRLSDLQDIIPRYPHLASVDLKCTAIGMASAQDAHQGPLTNGFHPPQTNGTLVNGTLTNGYH